MYQLIKKYTLCFTIMISLVISGTAVAKLKTVTGQLSLMATVDGKPAFRAVTWKLKPNSRRNRKTIKVYKHAATLDLEPGIYEISVSIDGKTLTRKITIKESSKQELIVSLD